MPALSSLVLRRSSPHVHELATSPSLDASLRDYLEKMAGQPLSLYEVDETKPGKGIWLIDTLSPEWERVWVEERAASSTFQPGEVFATRIVPTEPKVMSGSSYFFHRTAYLRVRGEILKGPKDKNGRVESSWVNTCTIKHWLLQLALQRSRSSSTRPVSPSC